MSDTFRNFGIIPEGQAPPPPSVRSYLSTGPIVGQYIGTGLLLAFGLTMAVVFALTLPVPQSVLAWAAAVLATFALAVVVGRHDYRWIELEGKTLRAKHLYTGFIVERSIDEIASLATLVHQGAGALETFVAHKLLGRVKGIEIRFRDRRDPLRVMRSDPAMTNSQELMEAVVYRMAEHRPLDTEIVEFHGQPLIRKIQYEGEPDIAKPGNFLKVLLVCLLCFAMIFGTILSYLWQSERTLRTLASVPPQPITLGDLVANGPGANRHVTITDFRDGGYAYESENGQWTQVWVALFPDVALAATEIPAVLYLKDVPSEVALRQRLRAGRITGICSQERRTSWGTQTGPNLVASNNGLPLTAAWDIDEVGEVPSAETVQWLSLSSLGCLAAAIVLALAILAMLW